MRMEKPRLWKVAMYEIRMFSTPSLSRWLDRLMSMTLYVYTLLTHMLLIVYESLLYGEQADVTISSLNANAQVEDQPREEELMLQTILIQYRRIKATLFKWMERKEEKKETKLHSYQRSSFLYTCIVYY